MKNKKLWIAILAVAILAPTAVLCFLMLTPDDFSLDDFASCSELSVTDSEGEKVTLCMDEENFILLTKILSIAQTSSEKEERSLASRLYTVECENGEHVCYLGIENGRSVIEWQNTVYILSYPYLRSEETVMCPRLARYGVKTVQGYLDAPILSQNTGSVYSIHTADDFSNLYFDGSCDDSSVEIFIYEQGSEEMFQAFSDFDDVTFDESKNWTIFVNAELLIGDYRVQCGYEFIFSSKAIN